MSDPHAIDPDEIIPPGSTPGRRQGAPRPAGPAPHPPQPAVTDIRGLLPHFIAKWLDEWLRIPGTNIRIGLDPLLALIPGLGDAASTSAGAIILLLAVRHRAPARVLLNMAGNMTGNALLNLIPVLGPAASIWFRSNSRNNQLLQNHLAGRPPGPTSPQTKALLVAVFLFIVLLFSVSLFVWSLVYKLVSSQFR